MAVMKRYDGTSTGNLRPGETRWQYNALGLPESHTDRIGITRRWHYDARGNLLRLENGNGGEYRFTYDPA